MLSKPRKIVAISSGGGHWIQMLRLRPAFEGCDVTYVTVNRGYQVDIPGCRLRVVADCNRHAKSRVLLTALQVLWLLLSLRPDVVISTGAAPGYLGIRLGRLVGAKTIWVDSIANVEELSLSGQAARACADLWLTQWPHLAVTQGPHFRGAVL